MFWIDQRDFAPSVLLNSDTAGRRGEATVLIAVVCCVAIAVAVLALVRFDVVVEAPGAVTPQSSSQIVSTPEEVTIEAFSVTEGQRVRKNDLLVVFQSEAASEGYLRAVAVRDSLKEEIAWIEAFIASPLSNATPKRYSVAPDHNEGQAVQRSLSSRVRQIDIQLAASAERMAGLTAAESEMRSILELSRAREAQDAELRRIGFRARSAVSEEQLSVRRASQDLVRTQMELASERRVLEKLQEDRKLSVAEVVRDVTSRLETRRLALDDAESRVREEAARTGRLAVHAEMDGIVDFADQSATARRIAKGVGVLRVVPARSERVVRAVVSDRDLPLVRKGQRAWVAYSAEYGVTKRQVRGEVLAVSSENMNFGDRAAQPDRPDNPLREKYYGVTVKLDDANSAPASGVNTAVRIVVGSQTVIRYVLTFVADEFADLSLTAR